MTASSWEPCGNNWIVSLTCLLLFVSEVTLGKDQSMGTLANQQVLLWQLLGNHWATGSNYVLCVYNPAQESDGRKNEEEQAVKKIELWASWKARAQNEVIKKQCGVAEMGGSRQSGV